jgi:hypothetical protein
VLSWISAGEGIPYGSCLYIRTRTRTHTHIHRVIKKSLCTLQLQYRKLQVMFKVSLADRRGQGDTRLTLTSSIIQNSNYVIMVTESVKYFCAFLYCIIRCTETFDHPVFISSLTNCNNCIAEMYVWGGARMWNSRLDQLIRQSN